MIDFEALSKKTLEEILEILPPDHELRTLTKEQLEASLPPKEDWDLQQAGKYAVWTTLNNAAISEKVVQSKTAFEEQRDLEEAKRKEVQERVLAEKNEARARKRALDEQMQKAQEEELKLKAEKAQERIKHRQIDPLGRMPQDVKLIQDGIAAILKTPLTKPAQNESVANPQKKEKNINAARRIAKVSKELEELALHVQVYGGNLSPQDMSAYITGSTSQDFGVLSERGFESLEQKQHFEKIEKYITSDLVKEKNEALKEIKGELFSLKKEKYRLENPRKEHDLPRGVTLSKKAQEKLEKLAKEAVPKPKTLSLGKQKKLNDLIFEHDKLSKEYDEQMRNKLEEKIGAKNMIIYDRLDLFDSFLNKMEKTEPELFSGEELKFYKELIDTIRYSRVEDLGKLHFTFLKEMNPAHIKSFEAAINDVQQFSQTLPDEKLGTAKPRERAEVKPAEPTNTTSTAAERESATRKKPAFLVDLRSNQGTALGGQEDSPTRGRAPTFTRTQSLPNITLPKLHTSPASPRKVGSSDLTRKKPEKPSSLLRALTKSRLKQSDDNNADNKPSKKGKKPE